MEITSENLWENYSSKESWKDVSKTHENLFRHGADSVIIRAGQLLKQFFNHKSDANKWLIADDDSELIRDFGEYCATLYGKEK